MKIISLILIWIIKFYRIFIRPIFPNSCRFDPSCSQYCIDALEIYGPIKGLKKSVLRILKCNPWFGHGGYDPVKKEELK